MTGGLRKLWSGAVPLPVAFWWYAVACGFAVNALATFASLATAAADGPNWLVGVLYLLPLPYNLLVLVAVWRSAARWEGVPSWASLARFAIAVWFVAATAL